jgi:hypothetical protein
MEDSTARIFGFDLADSLTSGEAIASVTSAIVMWKGNVADDPTPAVHLIGVPQFSGTKVSQLVSWVGAVGSPSQLPGDPLGILIGNIYALQFGAATNQSQVILPWARITIDKNYGPNIAYADGSAPSTAEIVTLPTPALNYILPTLGDHAQQDFPAIDQGEQRLFGFDFSPILSPNETILMAAALLIVESGDDAAVILDPLARFVGMPAISGSIAQQMIGLPPSPLLVPSDPEFPDLRGVTYILSMAVTTSSSQAIGTWARLRVGALYG